MIYKSTVPLCLLSCICFYLHFLPDSFGNYSHYVFSLMDVNGTGRINFQVQQNVQNTDVDAVLIRHIPNNHCPGLPGDLVHYGEGVSKGEDAVGGQTL